MKKRLLIILLFLLILLSFALAAERSSQQKVSPLNISVSNSNAKDPNLQCPEIDYSLLHERCVIQNNATILHKIEKGCLVYYCSVNLIDNSNTSFGECFMSLSFLLKEKLSYEQRLAYLITNGSLSEISDMKKKLSDKTNEVRLKQDICINLKQLVSTSLGDDVNNIDNNVNTNYTLFTQNVKRMDDKITELNSLLSNYGSLTNLNEIKENNPNKEELLTRLRTVNNSRKAMIANYIKYNAILNGSCDKDFLRRKIKDVIAEYEDATEKQDASSIMKLRDRMDSLVSENKFQIEFCPAKPTAISSDSVSNNTSCMDIIKKRAEIQKYIQQAHNKTNNFSNTDEFKKVDLLVRDISVQLPLCYKPESLSYSQIKNIALYDDSKTFEIITSNDASVNKMETLRLLRKDVVGRVFELMNTNENISFADVSLLVNKIKISKNEIFADNVRVNISNKILSVKLDGRPVVIKPILNGASIESEGIKAIADEISYENGNITVGGQIVNVLPNEAVGELGITTAVKKIEIKEEKDTDGKVKIVYDVFVPVKRKLLGFISVNGEDTFSVDGNTGDVIN